MWLQKMYISLYMHILFHIIYIQYYINNAKIYACNRPVKNGIFKEHVWGKNYGHAMNKSLQ